MNQHDNKYKLSLGKGGAWPGYRGELSQRSALYKVAEYEWSGKMRWLDTLNEVYVRLGNINKGWQMKVMKEQKTLRLLPCGVAQ